jgi:hypothetical protein
MSDPHETNGEFDPVVRPFVDFWSSYFSKANDATRDLLDGIHDASDVKSWQRSWMEAMSKSVDAYMRSPSFLQAMKHNTDLLIKTKQQTNDLAAEFARNANIPTAADISGLFERLHSVEETILGRLNGIDDRLEQIEQLVASRHEASAQA